MLHESRPSGSWLIFDVGQMMTPEVHSGSVSVHAERAIRVRREKRRKWRMFGIGLAVRLLGLALIWLGDGSPSVFRKMLVVLGVILSVGGITVLRYMLISGFRKKK
jgi:hypothetical protein